MLFSTVILPLIGRTARHHGPASGLIRRAVGPPAACSSPAVRQDNDAQNDRYRNDRGEPVHYAPIMHSGTVTRPSDGSRYSLVCPFREVAGSKSPGLLRTSMVNGRSVYRASCALHHEGPEHRAKGGQARGYPSPGSRLPRLLRRQRNSAGAGSILQSSAPAAFTP